MSPTRSSQRRNTELAGLREATAAAREAAAAAAAEEDGMPVYRVASLGGIHEDDVATPV